MVLLVIIHAHTLTEIVLSLFLFILLLFQDALRGIAALVLSDAEVLPDEEVGVSFDATDEDASIARAASPIRSRTGSPTRHMHLRTRSDSPGRSATAMYLIFLSLF